MTESRDNPRTAKRPFRISLRVTLLASFIVLIWGAAASLATIVYYSTERFLTPHAEILMENAVTSVLLQSQNRLETASDAAVLTKRLVQDEIVTSTDKRLMEKLFFEQMRLHTRFTGVYFGAPDGSFVYVNRRESDGPGRLRTQIIDSIEGRRQSVETLRGDDFGIMERRLNDDPYDPRQRPWYVKAVEQRGLIWVAPYIFYHSRLPGITTANPVYADDGRLLGVVAVDIGIAELSENLAKMHIGWGGKAFIFDRDGSIVAHSNPALVEGDNIQALPRISDIDDDLTRAAFASVPWKSAGGQYVLEDRRFGTFTRNGEEFLALFKSFNTPEPAWIVGMFLSKDAYLGTLKRGFIIFYAVAVVVTLLATLMAVVIYQHIRKPLAELEADAMAVTQKDLSAKAYSPTPFSEVTALYNAFGSMKAWIAEYQAENQKLQDELRQSHLETIILLAGCAEYRDKETAGHLLRMSEYAAIIAEGLNLSAREIELVAHAAPLHDVGKLGIPDAILTKPGKLTDAEWAIMRNHTNMGRDILNPARSDFVRIAQDIAYCHHEKYDGSGYPRGISGNDIPLTARIVAVTDSFDAMTSKRCYKDAIGFDQAMDILRQDVGTHFDPDCVKAFVANSDRVRVLYDHFRKEESEAGNPDTPIVCL
jgi:putative two-component system response regulator